MFPANFVCHGCSSRSSVHVKPISKREKLMDIPPIANTYSSSLPYSNIHFNFCIHEHFWYKRPNDVESELVHSTWEGSTKSSQIILHHSDIMLYKRLDRAISEVLSNWKDLFEDQHHSIIERTTRQLQRIMTINMLGVCVDVTLVINHVCDGGILIASEELSADGMVPASKSSIKMLELMKVDERNIKDECMVCLDEIGEETEVMCLPCLHMFHGECIIKWLENSHYCPLCRFEMPTDQTRLQKGSTI